MIYIRETIYKRADIEIVKTFPCGLVGIVLSSGGVRICDADDDFQEFYPLTPMLKPGTSGKSALELIEQLGKQYNLKG